MNKPLEMAEKSLLLKNLLERMVQIRGHSSFKLEGCITQEERNAIYTGLSLLRKEARSRGLERRTG